MTPKSSPPPRMLILVLLTGLTALTLNMFLPSLPKMAAEFQADYTVVSLSIAGYLAVTAVLQLFVGPLSDRYGRRPVLLAGLLLFVFASLGCALSRDVTVFLLFRMAQGVIITGWVMALAMIRDTTSPQRAASLIGYVTTAMALAPMLGPMIGGVLDELFGWRASFLLYIGVGTAVLLFCWLDLAETNLSPSETFAQQFKAYPKLFKARQFWGYAACMAFSTGAFYVFLAGAPLVAATALEISPKLLGFYMGVITAGFMLGCFLSGRYAGRFALTTLMLTGRLIACAGLVAGLLLFQAGFIHPYTLFGITLVVGLGNGLTMPSSNAGALSVRPELAGSAAGLSGSMIVAAGAALSSFTGAAVTEENGPYALFGIMLFCSLVSLAATLFVMWMDRREGPACASNSI